MNYTTLILCICTVALLAHEDNHGIVYKNIPKPLIEISNDVQDTSLIQLGRALFHDPILSRDSSISCTSCHSQYNAFSHSDHALSHGIEDRIGKRNAPALMNLAWQSSFMWDGASTSLEAQVLAPITNHDEMDNTLSAVLRTLRNSSRYRSAFFTVFHDSTITVDLVTKALARFERTFISFQSQYDSMKAGLVEFTDKEKRGYILFTKHCNHCHTEPLFSSYHYANNGLPFDTVLQDRGRYTITMDANDMYMFKIPSLRNIQYSGPYMHDGRFKKLSEVLLHYSEGIIPMNKNGLQNPLHLSSEERIDVIAFLLTLTDRRFLFNEQFTLIR